MKRASALYSLMIQRKGTVYMFKIQKSCGTCIMLENRNIFSLCLVFLEYMTGVQMTFLPWLGFLSEHMNDDLPVVIVLKLKW